MTKLKLIMGFAKVFNSIYSGTDSSHVISLCKHLEGEIL